MELEQAGQFEIEEAILITSTGNVIPVQSSIVEIAIYESIYSNSVMGELQIVNTIALQNEGPFIGQEYLSMKIRTPTLQDETFKLKFDENVFHITKVSRNYAGGAEILTFEFYSSELIHNQRTLISRTLRGTYHEMVESLLRKDLKCKKRLYIEQANDTKEYIANNVRPFDIIKNFAKHATALHHGLSSFVFFENLRGYHFRSLQSLYSEGSRFNYFEVATNTTSGDPSEPGTNNAKINAKVTKDLGTLLGVKISSNNDTTTTQAAGGLSSRLITHDIVQKKFNVNTYNYLDDKNLQKHGLEKYATRNAPQAGRKKDAPLYSSSEVDENGNRISDFIPVQYLTPVTTIKNKSGVYKNSQYEVYNGNKKETEYVFDPVKAENTLQKRRSLFTNLEMGLNLELWVNGQTTFGAGDMISVDIQKESKHSDDRKDKFLRNDFLVKSIKHVFNTANKKHHMYLTVAKDSIDEELEEVDHIEPKPVKQQPLFSDDHFYGDINGYDEEGKSAEASTSNIKSDFPLRSLASRR